MGNLGPFGIGGLVRDSLAVCIFRFSGPTGLCSASEAELVSLRAGLRECVDLGLSNIDMEGDS